MESNTENNIHDLGFIEHLATGSDIELFVQHKETKEIISAEGLIQGTKHEPFVFDASNKYFSTSLDNVLAEFTIPPATNAKEFYANIMKSRGYIDSVLPKEYCTVAEPSARLHERWLQTDQARVFGCEGDYNAYSGYRNQTPWSDDELLRSAGMHLHISYRYPKPYDKDDYEPDLCRANIIKSCDLHLGIPAVLMEPLNRRKELYGKAGSFRPKPYGVEYRTLSNYFVSSKGRIIWLYENAERAIEWLNKGNMIDKGLGEYVQHTINTNNKRDASLLVDKFKLEVI